MKSFLTIVIVISLNCGNHIAAQSSIKNDEEDHVAPMPFFLTNNDGGINGINSIPNYQCDYSIMPAVVIENFGAVDMTSATLEYFIDGGSPVTYEWQGILAPFNTDTFNLPLMNVSSGTHTLYINVTQANGEPDGNGGNDGSIQFNVVGSSEVTPYAETFEQPTLPAGFFVENANRGPTWKVTQFNNQNAAVNCVTMPFYINDVSGDVDDLFVQNIDLSNVAEAQLSFSVAYAYYSEYFWDELKVMMSTDCGSVWNLVYDKEKNDLATASATDVPFTPAADQWRNEMIDISTYAGYANVMIKFEAVSGHGNNLYIDNVAINDNNVGIGEAANETKQLKLFPNPANELVNVSFQNTTSGESEIVIFNCLGKEVYATGKQKASSSVIPVNQLAPGSYTIAISSDGQQLTAAPLIVFH